MEALAGRAVAVLARQGLVSAELVLDLAAVALPLPLGVEVAGVVVDLVRRPELPLVLLPVRPVAGLVLVSLLALPAVLCLVLRHLCLLVALVW